MPITLMHQLDVLVCGTCVTNTPKVPASLVADTNDRTVGVAMGEFSNYV